MKQILIVEDDSFLNKMVAYNLTADGYGVTSALNARTAAEAIRQREFDLVLLDINLPDGNGFELCKLIKPQHPDTIVIFLTANDQESDQIRGYEVGAVDYITKPFVIGALQRKIKAMFAMLEHHKPAKDIYDDGRLFLDFSEQTASLNGKPLTLSPMEYKMLNLFRKNPRQVLTRGQLLEKLWDIDEKFVDEHTLTTSISRIRSKIESDGGAPYIKTVYGMGYQWTGGEANEVAKPLGKAAVWPGGNRACPLHVRDHHSPVSCDKTDGGAADGRGAAAVRPCGDFCTDAGVWKAAVAVYR